MGLVRQFARLLFPSTMNATQSEIQIRNSYSRSKHLCQDKYMVTDQCLVVDNYDNVLTTASKKECHYKGGLLHRAFSLFLFRETQPSSGSLELLMQQRSASKITFPLLWTNSCCSHPCLNYAGETNETGAVGVKLAARRKVAHELGIDINKCLAVDDIHFLTRIIYSAPNEPVDGIWCEREIDYLLVSILPSSILADSSFLAPNPDEVAATSWLGIGPLESSVKANFCQYTPWFRSLVCSGHLRKMWQWVGAKALSSESYPLIDAMWDRSRIQELH
uniref:isopentenyl-diphosphate Delta-isomerase n=1 Tax=Mesocestoides corti TaxID=53468 RepID=A0A5K3FIK5_MESCO